MKQKFLFMILFSILSIVFNSCKDSDDATTDQDVKPAFDLADAKSKIEATNIEFGAFVAKGDSAGLSTLYTADAQLMGPNMPAASGKSSIQSTFGGMFNAMGKVGITLTAKEVWGTEDLVSEVGNYVMTGGDGKEIDKGKYIVLWKMEEGKWKMHRDIWNSDNPPAPSK